MNKLLELIENAKNIAITGHVSPDGDCTGSTLALYNYITENFEGKQVRVCLEKPSKKFSYMNGFDLISEDPFSEADLLVSLDASDRERLGSRGVMLDTAKESICIDHHVTNTNFAKFNIVEDFRSSTCELLYTLLDYDKISVNTAVCLYTGIVHDSGVFKYQSTTRQTMEIAGALIDKGFDFTKIIDDTYFKKDFNATKLLGLVLTNAKLIFDGKCCYGLLDYDTWTSYIDDKKKMDGIIDNLRNIDGVEIALFMYETAKDEHKVSLRSINANVSSIAAALGGGGHMRAAGATVHGKADELLENTILPMIKKELNG
ncbi:MAG: bifunctional oligoribonuclease/PAP phosphatase NrnA [Lachnospiraceae bacterium oral taxon 082]|nr:bifunctional oligoribonuclease/PAP phosphatase NrnA [Lachnospiraceae bacterium oral taxon 082]